MLVKKALLLACLLAPFSANAQSVQQSGNVTPGHAACWAITGVVYDCGDPGGGVSVVGSTTTNDFVAFNSSGSLIDSGINPANTSAISGLWNFNGGATAPTRPALDSSTNVATTAFVTGGVANIFTSPQTITALWTFNGGVAGSGPINMLNTTVPASFSTPAYSFNDVGITGLNFPDTSLHFAFTITGNSSPTGSGGYVGLNVSQFGVGRGPTAFVVGAIENAIAIGGSGHYFGSNPYVVVCGTAVVVGQCPLGTAAALSGATGMEVDFFGYAGGTTVYKEGVRITDQSAIQASGAGNLSTAITIARISSAPGFIYGLYFGDPTLGDSFFPLTTTGSAMKLSTAARAIDSIIDGSGLAGGVTNGAIRLPDGVAGFKWASWALLETNSLVAVQSNGGINAIQLGATASFVAGALTSGNPGTNAGAFIIQGLTTGVVTIQPGNANAGTFNFNLPVTAGAAGQVLTSQAGGSTAMTWTTVGQIIPMSSNGAVAQNSTVFEVSAQSATEGVASAVCPRAGTFKNLYVNTGAIGGSVQTVTATLRVNSGSSTITCQIATASTTCNDTTHTAACTVGQLYSLQVVTSATTGSVSFVNGGIEFDPN